MNNNVSPKFIPMNDLVLLKLVENKTQTYKGFEIPETAVGKYSMIMGTATAKGNDVTDQVVLGGNYLFERHSDNELLNPDGSPTGLTLVPEAALRCKVEVNTDE